MKGYGIHANRLQPGDVIPYAVDPPWWRFWNRKVEVRNLVVTSVVRVARGWKFEGIVEC